MVKEFEEFEPIFGKANAEWENPTTPTSLPLLPFLFHVHTLDDSHLRILATDFHSYTWETTRSIQQLEDLKDFAGVGTSWSEFVDYLLASIRSANVKLILGGFLESKELPGGHGATFVKSIAQKAKGMPQITISLDRVTYSSVNIVIANVSWELFVAFQSKHDLFIKERARCYQLSTLLAAEQEETEKKRKLSMLTGSEKPPPQEITKKVSIRVVPAYRREKVRGIVLDDSDDD